VTSIQWRFLWPFAGAVLVATLMAWWFASWLYAQTLERRLLSQLEHAATVLAQGRFPLTPEVLDGLARLLRADIAVRGARGEILLRTDPISTEDPPREDIAAPWPGGVGPYAQVEHALEPGRDARYRAVAMAADLSDLRAAAWTSAAWLAVGASALILGLTWFGHRIGRTITRPVQSLARMADAIAAGDREVRVPVERTDEIGALAGSLNVMAARLGRYEQELGERNRLAALGIVSARIAHEIRNPLTAIKLQVQLLAESVPETERGTVLDLEREIDRLGLVVAGVLDQARPQPPELRRRPVDPGALTRELADLFQPQMSHRGIRLTLDCPSDLPPADLDPERFKQVIVNLLVNARDALPQGGEIRLAWAQSVSHTGSPTTVPAGEGNGAAGSELIFTVDDSGPGLDQAAERRLAAGEGSDKPDGLGLGLKVSREIVMAHGGTLGLGRGPLGGLRVCIRLPCAAPMAQPVES
jgi:signal transduction histidine kinase